METKRKLTQAEIQARIEKSRTKKKKLPYGQKTEWPIENEYIKDAMLNELSPRQIAVKHERFEGAHGQFRGGLTIVVLNTPDFGMCIGYSRCIDKDNFSNSRGFRQALDRALDEWLFARSRKAAKDAKADS